MPCACCLSSTLCAHGVSVNPGRQTAKKAAVFCLDTLVTRGVGPRVTMGVLGPESTETLVCKLECFQLADKVN
jgi:hypothetical protein